MKPPIWTVSICTIMLLTAGNLYLLVRLLHCTPESNISLRRNTPLSSAQIKTLHRNPDSTASGSPFLKLGRWDDSRQYRISDFAYSGKEYENNQTVCLATQSSFDRLQWLPQIMEHWQGPVSLAIFVDYSDVNYLYHFLNYLKRCHYKWAEHLAVHIVRTGTLKEILEDPNSENPFQSCFNIDESFTKLLRQQRHLSSRWARGRIYPQNLMRNVARKGCSSGRVFLVDVDVIPSWNMSGLLSAFLENQRCAKCAYVIPTFELDRKAKFPRSKAELLADELQGLAQPFHLKAFRFNQYASNITRWRQANETEDVIISHSVTNYEFFYEPFYVATDSVPPHNERFLGYGFTRNTQVYEMVLAGWSFHVLSPVFTIHWDLQTKQWQPTWRKNQMEANRRLFDVIQQELKVRYEGRIPMKRQAKLNNRLRALSTL